MRILLLILVVQCYPAFAQFNPSMFKLIGSATSLNDSCYQLTPAQNKQSGSVWLRSPIDLREDFKVEALINLGDRDSLGADGVAFVLQPKSDVSGVIGGGMGYGGIDPSLAIEFDTWQNDDPPYDHIALVKNGVVFHSQEPDFTLQGPFELLPSGGNVEDGRARSVIITWDAKNLTLRCYYDGVVKIDYRGDIVKDIFSGDPMVYWGFTAATEGYFNVQTVCIKSAVRACDKIRVFIPTAFTPNGDQLNDMFYPLGPDPALVKSLRVFNRWGQIIFEKTNFPLNNKQFAWDGRFNGLLQPSGLYPYKMILNCNEGKGLEFKGTVTLMR
ncbi:MAG TPA: T9SS type B sorting domain-containing protein [Chitinophagaceae bacterium]|nr:T9SS type B sorting domain-containing protein [Chitinophagaceae bacterium]